MQTRPGRRLANADGVSIEVVFVLLRATEVEVGIVLQAVVGVVHAPDTPGDLPGPVVPRI